MEKKVKNVTCNFVNMNKNRYLLTISLLNIVHSFAYFSFQKYLKNPSFSGYFCANKNKCSQEREREIPKMAVN